MTTTTARAVFLGTLALCAALALGAAQVTGLEITARSLERATRVNLQDCPPGENRVRGVIRPVEDNEFATVELDVKVLPSFEGKTLEKPVVHDDAGTAYKTAQSFRDLEAGNAYTCSFSFRVPKGTKLESIAIGEARIDLATLEK